MTVNLTTVIEPFYISESSLAVRGMPKPLVKKDKISYLQVVENIFTSSENDEFVQAIRTNSFSFSESFQSSTRDFYLSHDKGPLKITFDEECFVTQPIKKLMKQCEIVYKYTLQALERLAKELNWENTTQYISFYATNDRFSIHSDDLYHWDSCVDHMNGAPAKFSFMILLSNPKDKNEGWKGGHLLYTAGRTYAYNQLNREEKNALFILNRATQGEMLNQPNSPVWKIKPRQNDGILLGNRHMRHKITPMYPMNERGQRMVFTILSYGTPSEVSF